MELFQPSLPELRELVFRLRRQLRDGLVRISTHQISPFSDEKISQELGQIDLVVDRFIAALPDPQASGQDASAGGDDSPASGDA